jgi:orotate phosphoribosyltransferase
VLILDDTWTTGSNAQAAALAVRRAGAAKVSIMVVARCLSPGYGPTANFIKTRLQQDYDPSSYSVTGGACL